MVSGISGGSNAAQLYQQLNVDMGRLSQAGNSMPTEQLQKLLSQMQHIEDQLGIGSQKGGRLNPQSKMAYGMPNPSNAYGASHGHVGGSYYNGPSANRGGSMANQINHAIGQFNNAQSFINQGRGMMPGQNGGGVQRFPNSPGAGPGGARGPGGGNGGNSWMTQGVPQKPAYNPKLTPAQNKQALQAWKETAQTAINEDINKHYTEISNQLTAENATMNSLIANLNR